MGKLKWQRLADGSWLAPEVPIRLMRNDRSVRYQVLVPLERDVSFSDGWEWADCVIGFENQRYNLPGAKEWAEDNVDFCRKYLAEDYDGDPVADAVDRQRQHDEWLARMREQGKL